MRINEIISKIDPEEDYQIKQIKELFGVSNTAVLGAVRRGRLDARKLFNKYYITGRSLRDFLLGEKKFYNKP